MKIATFNVNSIKVRQDIVSQWLQDTGTDVLLLQETKTIDEDFPSSVFEALGYQAFVFGQKTYNGVAILAKRTSFGKMTRLTKGIPDFPDTQARVIAVELTPNGAEKPILCTSLYCPNGQAVSSQKYLYKLDWLAALAQWMRRCVADGKSCVFAGDMNIAPTDADVWDPKSWEGNILVSKPERDAFQALLATGFIDTWSLGLHAPDTFSWWDYRASGFEKNHGLRIDHIFVTPDLAERVESVDIDTKPRALEKPSDHTPVIATFR